MRPSLGATISSFLIPSKHFFKCTYTINRGEQVPNIITIKCVCVCTSIEPSIIWVWKTRSKWAIYIEERECPQPAHYVGPWLVQGYPKGFHWRESRTEGIVAFWAPSKYRGTFGSSLKSCPCCWRCQTNRVCTQLYGHSKWTRQNAHQIQFLSSCMCHTINIILVSSSVCNSTSKNPI